MKTKALYRFIEFIRPGGYWPSQYTIEQAFGVFAWMVHTGKDYGDKVPYVTQSVDSLLSCKPECGVADVKPITSIADLRKRFHYAVLGNPYVGPNVTKWRNTFGITTDGKRIVHFPHYDYMEAPICFADVEKAITAMFEAKGNLSVQLNEHHADAIEVYRCEVHPYNELWTWTLKYGCDHSGWHHTLSTQNKGETFLDCTIRAYDALRVLLPQLSPLPLIKRAA